MNDSRNNLMKALRLDKPAPQPQSAPKAVESDEDDCFAFGYLRGVGDRSLHLQFRLATGNSESFPYSWLGPVSFDPSCGIVLTFVGDKTYKVTIRGRNLGVFMGDNIDLLNRGILRHRIVWIREMEPEECRKLPEEALTVERIVIEIEAAEA